ncbi:hypothetical protein [Polyangium mundeleinium]|uniref:ATP-binding protein n=1 Tax=Polyangium mundeleinium TaxID=2995306 RepID=A0ABT5EJR5_9BACT|nr:hypothetical protein [Polyangium mundeleinium]MDC0740981.1 hypothetical protein [Polyangium mundeleinium]
MTGMAEEGREILARGRIRVDARRALAKLREHLLVDLHLYAAEIARAAVASGATFLDVQYDADDVVFVFDGEPVVETELPRLLDHVLGDSGGSGRVLRGLALGVNAALGLEPSFVDIHVRAAGDTNAVRVRFVPSVLAGEDAPLPEVVRVALPKGMPERGTRVHVRRRIGFETLKRAARRELPREIGLLADAMHDAPLALRRAGEKLPLAPRPPALLRVRFREKDLRRGVVEILAVPAGPPVVEYLELGVLLLRRPFAAEPMFPSAAHAQVELPVRVLVDADELPTNASRSALREDAGMMLRAEQAARSAFVDALRTLVALVTGEGKPLPDVEVLDHDKARLEDALGAFVCVAAGALRRGVDLPDQARALLELPLLRNAVGGSLTPMALLSRDKEPVYVFEGKEPAPAELEPWLDDVVWARGRLGERILVDFEIQDAGKRIAAAHAAHERRRRLHARPRSEPAVPSEPDHVVKETFHVKDGPFRGLRGQLALGAEGIGSGQRPSTVRVYVEGRHIDTITVDRDKLPLAIDAALAWDGQIVPRFSYEGVHDSEALRLAMFQLTRLSLLALGSHVERLAQDKRAGDLERLRPLVRAAVGAFVLAAEALGIENPPPEPALSAYTPLWTRSFWPSPDPDRLPLSLAELRSYVDRTNAICHAPPGSSGVAPDKRPVVAVTDLELGWLEKVFRGVTLVPYARALRSPREPVTPRLAMFHELCASRRAEGEVLPSMPFEAQQGRGVIAPARKDEIFWLHAGVLLQVVATGKYIEPTTIVIEYDGLVPAPSWDRIAWTRDMAFLVPVRDELLRRIVAALEGNAEARASLRDAPTGTPGPLLRAYVIEAITRHRGHELTARIEALPLVPVLDEEGRPKFVSLESVRKTHPEPEMIPFLREVPDFPTLSWRPVLCLDDREAYAFERWAGGRAKNAKGELDVRREGARTEYDRQVFRAKPVLDPFVCGPLAEPEGLTALWYEEEQTETSMSVAAALPRRGLELPAADVEILLDKRLLCTRQLTGMPVPVVARILLASEAFVVPFSDLTPSGVSVAEARVYSAACSLAAGLVERAKGRELTAFFGDLRVLRLVATLYKVSAQDRARSDILQADFALRSADFRWPTVQGDARAFAELVPGGAKLFYGRARYTQWQTPTRGGSELDAPIVHTPSSPEGDLLLEILVGMGYELVDVSEAVAALQARRTGEAAQGRPRLPGSPVHPLLRVDLASLHSHYEGEIELTESGRADVQVETLRGEVVTLDVEGMFPFRAKVRVEDVELDDKDKRDLAVDLTKAAKKHLETLADKLDELPAFVRTSLRRVVCAHSRKDQTLAKRRLTMRVFPDILGGFHSIADVAGDGSSDYPYVNFPPPYPSAPRPRPPLALTSEEFEAIRSRALFEDVSQAIKRELVAEQRRASRPLDFIGLDATQRAKCLEVVPFRGDGVLGEIGILMPEHAAARGIHVHTTGRLLCRILDGDGWPVLAVVNDDALPTNRGFDGIKGHVAREGLRARVVGQANEHLAKWLAPPPGGLVELSVHGPLPGVPFFVKGMLWLPPSWAGAGRIEVRDATKKETVACHYEVAGLKHFDGMVPVCGRLLVAPTKVGNLEKVNMGAVLTRFLVERTIEMVEAAEEKGAPAELVEGYRWILKLLGGDVGELEVVAADGTRVQASEVVAQVEAKGEIWVTRHEGTAEGVFPGEAPPFVLRDGGVLASVLRARTRIVRELGGAVPEKRAAPAPEAMQPEVLAAVHAFTYGSGMPNALARPGVEVTPFVAPDVVEPKAPEAESGIEEEPASSWFGGLVSRVVLLFGPSEPVEPATRALGPSLMQAIDKLGLAPTQVVTGVRYARSGRPLRFDAVSGKLVLNRSHPAVRALAAKAAEDPRARTLLVAAAVREINRVLEVVTDATEKRVLLSLLRGEPL